MDNYPDREPAFAEGQIRHEDNLINHRMGWLMASNAFLFSAFGVVVNAFIQNQNNVSAKPLLGAFLIIIPLLAAIVSWFIWELVRAATKQVDKISIWWDLMFLPREKYQFIPKDAYPALVGDPVYGFKGRLNIYAILPFILVLAWSFLLCLAIAMLELQIHSFILLMALAFLVFASWHFRKYIWPFCMFKSSRNFPHTYLVSDFQWDVNLIKQSLESHQSITLTSNGESKIVIRKAEASEKLINDSESQRLTSYQWNAKDLIIQFFTSDKPSGKLIILTSNNGEPEIVIQKAEPNN
jgi:hypothetical protein